MMPEVTSLPHVEKKYKMINKKKDIHYTRR